MGEWIAAVSRETWGATPAVGVRAGRRHRSHRLAPSVTARKKGRATSPSLRDREETVTLTSPFVILRRPATGGPSGADA